MFTQSRGRRRRNSRKVQAVALLGATLDACTLSGQPPPCCHAGREGTRFRVWREAAFRLIDCSFARSLARSQSHLLRNPLIDSAWFAFAALVTDLRAQDSLRRGVPTGSHQLLVTHGTLGSSPLPLIR
jgi:hypothetical protein